MRRVKSRWGLPFILDKCLDVAIYLNSRRLVSYVLGIEFKCPVCRHKTTLEECNVETIDGNWIECDWCPRHWNLRYHSTDGGNYPTFNDEGCQSKSYKWLTIFRTGNVEIQVERLFKALGLRAWLNVEMEFETEKTFMVYFRLDKVSAPSLAEYHNPSPQMPIVFVGIDPWELWEQIGHGVRPKDRGTWLSFSLGKWRIVNI